MDDLKLFMRVKNISYWKIAKILGVHRQTIYNWMQKYNQEHYQKIINAIEMIGE